MPKMSNVGRLIGKTSTSSWITTFGTAKADEYKQFCWAHCPHEDTPCKGICPEMKEWIKKYKENKQENGKH